MDKNSLKPFGEVFKIRGEKSLEIFENTACVRALTADKTQNRITAYLYSERIIAPSEIRAAEKVIAERYRLNRATLLPSYPRSLFGDEYFLTLAKRLCEEFPAAIGYLSGAQWTYDGEATLTLTLKTGLNGFSDKCIRFIRSAIENEFSMNIDVLTEVAEGTDYAAEERLMSLRREIEEAAKVSAEKPKPAPVKEEPVAAPAKEGFKGFRKKLNEEQGEVVLGKSAFGEYIDINTIEEAFGDISIKGEIFATECREFEERGVATYSFDMTDYKGSVRVVVRNIKLENLGDVSGKLKKGAYVHVYGSTQYDMYLKDTVVRPRNIVLGKAPSREDTAPEKRVELHMHTNMSTMDGITPTADLLKRAAGWGHKAIAVTDHGVVQAFPDAMNAAPKLGIKVLYGVEAYYGGNRKTQVVTGSIPSGFDGEFVCFDIETTGLYKKTCKIIEIAAAILRNGEICEKFQTYVNPECAIPEKISELTGITNGMVVDSPKIDKALRDFLDFVGDRPLAAHNAEFDVGFITEACKALGIEREFNYIDSLELSRKLLPDTKNHKLDTVAKALKLPKFEHHRALDDAVTVAFILRALFSELSEVHKLSKVSELNGFSIGSKEKEKLNRFHMIIIAKNYVGLKNLYKLISISHLEYYDRRPIIPRHVLEKHREGLIVGSACEAGELYGAIVEGKKYSELLKIADFYDFLEIQPVGNNAFMLANGIASSEEDIRNFNRTVVKLGDELGVPVVATGDVHFLDPHDEVYRRVLMASKNFADADNQAPLYLKTTNEMLDEFSYLGDKKAYEVVVKNTNMIADMCEEIRPIPEGQYPPAIEGSKEELKMLCYNKAKELYGEPLHDTVRERLEYELSKIIGHDFDVMYMIAQKLVTQSVSDGYLVGSRGSVGSSFVAFLSGITEVNALPPHYRCKKCKNVVFESSGEYAAGADLPNRNCEVCGEPMVKDGFNIPFQTFLGFDGDKTPDIDLNFSGEYQSTAHGQVEDLFGQGHVFRAGTIATVADKTAFGYVKKYAEERSMNMTQAERNRIVIGCTGIKRTTGQHPGGVMIVPKDKEIYDFTPVQHPADDKDSDIITTHFDYHSIHDNLLKLDMLGHDDPTIIRMLEDLTGLNAREIPLDDPETMSIFTSISALGIDEDPILGKTGSVAVPEFGTHFVRQMLLDTQPTTFDELVRISGLSHGTDVWLTNAQDLVRDGVATLKQVICARDDIMLYLIDKGVDPKLSFTIMESVRKGKGLKPDWEEEMLSHDVPQWYVDSCKKIKYMFPKAHAVAYVMMAFRIAWFKVHHPKAFYAAYFSIRAKAFDASVMTNGDAVVLSKMDELNAMEKISQKEENMLVTLEVCHEFYKRGLTFDPINLYESDTKNFKITENGLIPPFTAISGLGEVAAQNIVDERVNGRFMSIEEMQNRCKRVSKGVIEMLEANNVLRDIPNTSQVSLF
ncbi:MAG: PolC-type DNA polymerase III [Ruminococcaceae bacterium]|nr:PolC-type DNA polymerase III [Oscillospiraceae bacterium]